MKIFTAIGFFMCCMLPQVQANFEKLVSIDDPLFEDISDFVHLELYDDRYLFFSGYDKYGESELIQYNNYPFVYDLEKSRVLDISLDRDVNIRLGDNSVLYSWYQIENRNSCRYHDDKLYCQTLEFDLDNDIRKANNNLSFYDFIEYKGVTYGVSFGSSFSLYQYKDHHWSLYHQTDNNKLLPKKCDISPLDTRLELRLLDDKLFVVSSGEVAVYDFVTNEYDFLADLSILPDTIEKRCEDLFQIQEYGEDLYIVRKELLYEYGRIHDYFFAFDGRADVWKISGKSGHIDKILEYEMDWKFGLRNNSIQLIVNQDGQYWIGIDQETKRYRLYKIEDGNLRFLEDLQMVEENVLGYINENSYTNLYKNNLSGMYLLLWEGSETVKPWRIESDRIVYYPEMKKPAVVQLNHYHQLTVDTLLLVSEKMPTDTSAACLVFSLVNWKTGEIISMDSLCNAGYWISDKPLISNGSIYFISGDESNVQTIWRYRIDKTTSVKRETLNSNLSLSIFPNPVSQFATLLSTEKLNGQLMITGIDGKIYQSVRVDGFQQVIDVSQLNSGMYIAVYQDSLNISTQRFIIQR